MPRNESENHKIFHIANLQIPNHMDHLTNKEVNKILARKGFFFWLGMNRDAENFNQWYDFFTGEKLEFFKWSPVGRRKEPGKSPTFYDAHRNYTIQPETKYPIFFKYTYTYPNENGITKIRMGDESTKCQCVCMGQLRETYTHEIVGTGFIAKSACQIECSFLNLRIPFFGNTLFFHFELGLDCILAKKSELQDFEEQTNVSPPYWLDTSRVNVKEGWRNDKGSTRVTENSLPWDQSQFREYYIDQDHKNVVMGNVSFKQ